METSIAMADFQRTMLTPFFNQGPPRIHIANTRAPAMCETSSFRGEKSAHSDCAQRAIIFHLTWASLEPRGFLPLPTKKGVPFQTAWNFGPKRINQTTVTFCGSATLQPKVLRAQLLEDPRVLAGTVCFSCSFSRFRGWGFRILSTSGAMDENLASHMVGLSIPLFFVGDHAIYDLHSFWWSHVGSSSCMRMTISRSKSRFGSIL